MSEKYNQEKAYEQLANILTEIYAGDRAMYPDEFEGAGGLVVAYEEDEDGDIACCIYPFSDKVVIESVDTPPITVC